MRSGRLDSGPDRGRTVVGESDLETHQLQQVDEAVGHVLVVFHQEDAAWAGMRRRCGRAVRTSPEAPANGIVSVNSAPLSIPSLAAESDPPCSVASRLAIARPRPSPPPARSRPCSCCVNGSNSLPRELLVESDAGVLDA